MIALLLAGALHLGLGHHWFPHGPGLGWGYGLGATVGVGVVPTTAVQYINGVPYEVINGSLVPVSVAGFGVL